MICSLSDVMGGKSLCYSLMMWRIGQEENVSKSQHLSCKLLVGDALCSAYIQWRPH